MHRATSRTSGVLARNPWTSRAEAQRSEVPGWVLITIMTAALVAALWLVAEPLLAQLFRAT